jgi:hypothetical protein
MRVCVRGGKSADEWKQSARHVGHSPGRSHDEVPFGHSIFSRLGIFTMRSKPVFNRMKEVLYKGVLLQFQFHLCLSVRILLRMYGVG